MLRDIKLASLFSLYAYLFARVNGGRGVYYHSNTQIKTTALAKNASSSAQQLFVYSIVCILRVIALTVISTGDTHNRRPQLYTKVVSPRENQYINVSFFIPTAYFEG